MEVNGAVEKPNLGNKIVQPRERGDVKSGLLTTLPLLTRDKDTAATMLLRSLLMQTGVAMQCPTLRKGLGESTRSLTLRFPTTQP